MKCLILAAGYATRLYPLTENFPKPLLTVGDKTILDWLVDDINQSGLVDEYIIISNDKYAEHFEKWAVEKDMNIAVVNDKTTSNETRLGAVKDIWFAIEAKKVEDDVLIIAGDNVLDFSLSKFLDYCVDKKRSCNMRYFEADKEKLKKSGVLKIDENEKIIDMEEKPQMPQSNWCSPPFYYYLKEDIQLIPKAIESGCGIDAPGSFVGWLSKETAVHSMEMPGKRYDIGNLESYEKVQEGYKGVIKG